jgi:hypothetical protein
VHLPGLAHSKLIIWKIIERTCIFI